MCVAYMFSFGVSARLSILWPTLTYKASNVNNNMKLPSERQTTMFSSAWIVGIVLVSSTAGLDHKSHPNSFNQNITTCEQFERGARFSPYMVVDSMWKVFYFWSNNTELYPIYFSIPAKKKILKFKEVFDVIYGDMEVEWEKAVLTMDPRPGVEILFLYAGTPGALRAFIKQERRSKERPHPAPLTNIADVRMKLVDKWLGIICCEDLSAFALARIDHLPTTEEECAEAAADLGLKPAHGRPYLHFKKNNKEL